jgi:hypothetical protein
MDVCLQPCVLYPRSLDREHPAQINMMPFNMADITSLPENLRGYWRVRLA